MDLSGLTVAKARRMIQAGELSPVQLVDAVNGAIENTDPQIGGYLSRDYERARAAAERADTKLPLGGIPIAIKDVINVQGEPCGCASKILTGYTAPYDATVIKKLRAAGASGPQRRSAKPRRARGRAGQNGSRERPFSAISPRCARNMRSLPGNPGRPSWWQSCRAQINTPRRT